MDGSATSHTWMLVRHDSFMRHFLSPDADKHAAEISFTVCLFVTLFVCPQRFCGVQTLRTQDTSEFGPKTLRTYQSSDPGHFGMTKVSGHFSTGAKVSYGHFGTRQYLHRRPIALHIMQRPTSETQRITVNLTQAACFKCMFYFVCFYCTATFVA